MQNKANEDVESGESGTFCASVLKCQKKLTGHIDDKRLILLVFRELTQICEKKTP